MTELRTRPMTADEFATFRAELIARYAADKAEAGNWPADQAGALAARQVDGLLPQGAGTAGMLLLIAETPAHERVGHVWVQLRSPEAGGEAWIFDIEVEPAQRGKGHGRALLAAAERETAAHGVPTIGLNVFGANVVARDLYESSGYEITSMQMRKHLAAAGPGAPR